MPNCSVQEQRSKEAKKLSLRHSTQMQLEFGLTIFWPPFLGTMCGGQAAICICSFSASRRSVWMWAASVWISKLCRYLCHFWQYLRRRWGSVINLQHLAVDVASCQLPVARCRSLVARCKLHAAVCRAVSQEYVNWLANGCQCISLWCAWTGVELKSCS